MQLNNKKVFVVQRIYYDENVVNFLLGPESYSEEQFQELFQNIFDCSSIKILEKTSKENYRAYLDDIIEDVFIHIIQFGFEKYSPPKITLFGSELTEEFVKDKQIQKLIIEYNEIARY